MTSIKVDVDTHGPVFDGRAQAAARAYVAAATEEIASEGKQDVDTRLPQVLRNPTGYYQAHITNDRVTATSWRIHDDMVIYGPWLEGVGSRNKTTRFKGYFTFRLVGQQLKGKAVAIAERVLPQYLRAMR